MSAPLTRREEDALRFIAGFVEAHGYGPRQIDVAHGIGVASKGNAAHLISGLERKGRLRRIPHLERAVAPVGPVAIPRAPDGAPLHFVRPTP